jgi:hypothetical protein
MCDPLSIAGLVATAASTGLGYSAQQQQASARDGALAAERIRQNQFNQEAAALNTQSQDRYQDFGAKQEQKAAKLTDMFTEAPATLPPTADPMPASSSNLVVQNEAKQRGEARDRTNQIGGALGNLRSFADMLGDTSRLQARDASKVGQIGNFKKGSSNVLGMELEAANSAGSGQRMLGDVLGGLGRIGLGAGLSGAGGVSTSANFVPNASSPFAFGSGGYTGMGPFMGAGQQSSGLFNIFGGR